jgi:hypothetical protein
MMRISQWKVRSLHVLSLYLFSIGLAIPCLGQSFSPPVLIYPPDGDSLKTKFPLFTWTPIYPMPLTAKVMYRIRMVEMLEEQTPEAAIQANPDWYAQENLLNTALAYPIAAPRLQADKKYAWQVEATYQETKSLAIAPNNKPTAKRASPTSPQNNLTINMVSDVLLSEVFWFGIEDITEDSVCVLALATTPSSKTYGVRKNVLHFKLDDVIPEEVKELTWHISDLNGNLVHDTPLIPTPESRKRHYKIALSSVATFRKKASRDKVFLLQASSKNGNTYSLRFVTY